MTRVPKTDQLSALRLSSGIGAEHSILPVHAVLVPRARDFHRAPHSLCVLPSPADGVEPGPQVSRASRVSGLRECPWRNAPLHWWRSSMCLLPLASPVGLSESDSVSARPSASLTASR
jgi:hypothetical protein